MEPNEIPSPLTPETPLPSPEPVVFFPSLIELPLLQLEEEGAETVALPGWKRVLDWTCILVSLPIWLPVFVGIVLWVGIASPGSPFFKQMRVGARGVPFRMWKFRTMRADAETASHEAHLAALMDGDGPMKKLDGTDPRIIPGGRILRSLGLDELPQLFNVLRGEMSLVGPRPCTLYEFKRYDVRFARRFAVAPGLTGYWQVNGKNRTTFREMVEMDLWYTRNRSLGVDLEIMGRTVPALLTQALEKSKNKKKT